MSRLYAFGCSFTQNEYPTWADLLSNYYDEYENWAISGLGNRGIFNRLNEAILKRQIDKNDTVVVMWSTPVREDRLYEGKSWRTVGSVYNQDFYPKEWVEKYFNPFMGLMETVNYVHAAQHLLDSIGCNWTMSWMVELTPSNPNQDWGEMAPSYIPISELCDPDFKLEKYIKRISKHPRMIPGEMDEFKRYAKDKYNIPNLIVDTPPRIDDHPNSLAGYYYIKEKIAPVLGLQDFDSDSKIFKLATDWSDYTSKDYRSKNVPPFTFKHNTPRDVLPKDAF